MTWTTGQLVVGTLFLLGIGAVVTSAVLRCRRVARPTASGDDSNGASTTTDDDDDAALQAARARQASHEAALSAERARRRAAAMQAQLQQSLRNLGVEAASVSGQRVGSSPGFSSASSSAAVAESRIIREQQERDYAAALARDRASAETAAREAAVKAEQELQAALRLSRLTHLAASVPPEPPAGSARVCTLALRWADGSRTDRRFAADERLGTVLDFVESLARHEPHERVALFASFPRRALLDRDATLQQLGLVPNAVLNVDFLDEADE